MVTHWAPPESHLPLCILDGTCAMRDEECVAVRSAEGVTCPECETGMIARLQQDRQDRGADGMPVPGRYDPLTLSHCVKVTEQWIVHVAPMIFNDRITLTSRREYPMSYTAGWCYDKGAAAVLAAQVWDPETQHSPVGFKKIACDGRSAPR